MQCFNSQKFLGSQANEKGKCTIDLFVCCLTLPLSYSKKKQKTQYDFQFTLFCLLLFFYFVHTYINNTLYTGLITFLIYILIIKKLMLFYSIAHRSSSQCLFWKDTAKLCYIIHLSQECYTPPQGAWNQIVYYKSLLQYLSLDRVLGHLV